MKAYAILLCAIIFEVCATSLIKKSDGFTNLVPSGALIFCYAISFYLLSISVKTIPLGVAYAIWSGVGIVAISLVGFFVYRQVLDCPAIIGIVLITAGCLIINLFSKSSAH